MTTELPFGTRLIGQTEKALNAILERLLAPHGVSEPQWVALKIALDSGPVPAGELADHLARTVRTAPDLARARLDELEALGSIATSADGLTVAVTPAGRAFHRHILDSIEPITARLWGDLPAAGVDEAGRVLNTVLRRADAELARL